LPKSELRSASSAKALNARAQEKGLGIIVAQFVYLLETCITINHSDAFASCLSLVKTALGCRAGFGIYYQWHWAYDAAVHGRNVRVGSLITKSRVL
jgi:hypothetical protein